METHSSPSPTHAAVLFILSLRGLSSQETARSGNTYGMLGMAIAIFATVTAAAQQYAFIRSPSSWAPSSAWRPRSP